MFLQLHKVIARSVSKPEVLSKNLNSSPLRPSTTCKSWAVVVLCQGREEEESHVSGLQL